MLDHVEDTVYAKNLRDGPTWVSPKDSDEARENIREKDTPNLVLADSDQNSDVSGVAALQSAPLVNNSPSPGVSGSSIMLSTTIPHCNPPRTRKSSYCHKL